MNFKIYTLADITPTGARRGEGLAYHQEQNYMTVIQTIGIRTNPVNVKVDSKTVSIKDLGFGSNYKGKQCVWTMSFDIESQGGHSIELLQDDFNLVPFINNTNETVKFEKSLFISKDPDFCNIFFEFEDK